jgi:hypothetical protein
MPLINAAGPLSEGQINSRQLVTGVTDPTVYAVKVVVNAGTTLSVSGNTKTAGNFVVDWGDGSAAVTATTAADSTLNTPVTGWGSASSNPTTVTHTYGIAGTYYITVKSSTGYLWCNIGNNSRVCFIATGDPATTIAGDDTVVDVIQWGVAKFYRTNNMFRGNSQLIAISALDTPDFSECVSMDGMFVWAESFNVNIANWNTKTVASMASMFAYALSFNQSLTTWCVTNVKTVPTNSSGVASFAISAPLPTSKYPIWNTCNGIPTPTPPSTLVVTAAASSYGYTQGLAVPTTKAVNVTGGTTPYSYSISPDLATAIPGLTWYSNIGSWSGTPTTALGSVPTFVVTVTDSGSPQQVKTAGFSISVGGAFALQTIGSNTNFIVGTAVGITLLLTINASKIDAHNFYPVTWTVSNQSVLTNAGLVVTTAGGGLFISGTPTSSFASTSFVFTAVDQHTGQTATITVIMSCANPQVVLTSTPVSGTVGILDYLNPFVVSGGTPPYKNYRISPGVPGHTIDSATGNISGTFPVGAQTATYTISVDDSAKPTPTTASTTTTIVVNQPLVITMSGVVGGIAQLYKGSSVTLTPTVTGTIGSIISYSLSGAMLPTGVTFNTTTGVISGTPTVATYTGKVGITVSDTGGRTATVNFTIQVEDFNVTVAIADSKLTVGVTSTFQPAAVTGTTRTNPYSLDISLPAGLTLDAATGKISGAPSAVSPKTTYTMYVQGTVTTKSIQFTIQAANQFVLANSGPLLLDQNLAMTQSTPVTASGGYTPYTYKLGTGVVLPPGIVMSSTGIFSGTPTTASTSKGYGITVTDGAGQVKNETITISSTAAPVITITKTSLPLIHNAPLATTNLATATGGVLPITFSAVGLPVGIVMDSATGNVSGTPTTNVGLTTVTVQAQDPRGRVSAGTLTTIVTDPMTISLAKSSVATTVGRDISVAITTAGGTAPYTYTSDLPTGFSISGGIIIGKSAVAISSRPYTITATDKYGGKISTTLTLQVNAAITVTLSRTTAYLVLGEGLTVLPTVAGGTAPYTYTIDKAIPATTGISFDTSNGTINGNTKLTFAAITYKITVTDSVGATGSATIEMECVDVLSLTLAPAQNFIINTSTWMTGTISGGTPPYTVSSITTFPGMTWGSNLSSGSVKIASGTPSVLTNTQYTIKITDLRNRTTTAVTQINVANALKIGTRSAAYISYTLNNPIANATLFPFTSGGTPPYTYDISGGILPSGLSFYTNTGVLSGTPTVASSTSTFTVTVTDAVGRTDFSNINIDQEITVAPTAVMTYQYVATQKDLKFTPMVVNGGTKPYSYVMSQQITGIQVDKNTGVITATVPPNSTKYYIFRTTPSGVFPFVNGLIVSDSANANYDSISPGTNRTYAYQGLICRNFSTTVETAATAGHPVNTNSLIGAITGGVPPYIVSYQNPQPSTATLGNFTLDPISMGQSNISITGDAFANVYVVTPSDRMTCDIVITDRYNQKLTIPVIFKQIMTVSAVGGGPLMFTYGTNNIGRKTVNVTGGAAPFTYTLSGTGSQYFTLAANSGYIGGGITAPKGSYNLTVNVTGSTGGAVTNDKGSAAITIFVS